MKVFKIKMEYMGTKFNGSKVIELNENTSQKDLNFIFNECPNYQGIFDIPQAPKKEKSKK